jgi:DNA-binding response OmpR family regulator
MARILLIDDDPALLDVLCMALGEAGHEVDAARDGHEGLRRLRAAPAALIISDVNMPGLDGFALCRRLRQDGVTAPILLLTSRDSEIDEALGLDLGADDYVCKPLRTRALLARVEALLRREALRSGAKASRPPLLRGALALCSERLEVRYGGRLVTVTVTEFRLLEALALRPGVLFSRDRLLEIIRGDDTVVAPRLIDTYVRRLRRKLEQADPAFDAIETVIGAGYRLRAEGDLG